MSTPEIIEATTQELVLFAEPSTEVVEASAQEIVLIAESSTELVESSAQGPMGPRGPQGLSGVSVSAYVAATPISGHTAVVLDALGQAMPADPTNPAHHAVAGITTQAGVIGDSAEVANKGAMEHAGWTFTPGLPIFLGLAGVITQALPPSAVFSKVLGVAVSPTRISVDFQPAIFR